MSTDAASMCDEIASFSFLLINSLFTDLDQALEALVDVSELKYRNDQ